MLHNLNYTTGDFDEETPGNSEFVKNDLKYEEISINELFNIFFIKKKLKLINWECKNDAYPLTDNLLDSTNLCSILTKKNLKYKILFATRQLPIENTKIIKAISNLIKRNIGGSINKEDFQNALDEITNPDDYNQQMSNIIEDWFMSYIYSSGVNSLQPKFTKGRRNLIGNLVILQFPNSCNTSEVMWREHLTDLMLMNAKGETQFHMDLTLASQEVSEIQELKGKFFPKATVINLSGSGYFKSLFDEMSCEFLLKTKHIQLNSGAVLLFIDYLISNLYYIEYIEYFLNNFSQEKNFLIKKYF